MSSGIIHADFFSKQIIGSDVFETDIFDAAINEIRDSAGRIIGEGVVDPTFSGLGLTASGASINNRRLNVTGDLPCQNGEGYIIKEAGNSGTQRTVTEGVRTIVLHDPVWYELLPFENADGTTYRVYLSEVEFPVSVGNGKDGGRGYSRAVNAVGVALNPSSVVDVGAYLELRFNATVLNTLGIQLWNLDVANREDVNYSYDCVVWLDTDVTGVTVQSDDPDVAIAYNAKLVQDSAGAYLKIELNGFGDGKLGQSIASTTPAHYKVAILGPLITTTDFDADPKYIHVGTTDSAIGGETIDTSGQIVFLSVSEAVAQAMEVPDELHYRGWITRPTVTVAATDIDVTSTGEVFANGVVKDTPIFNNLVPLSSNNRHYVYYDTADSDYKIADSAIAIFNDNHIPLLQCDTDGGGQFITSTQKFIARSARQLDILAELTVSGESTHFAMFGDLEEALAYAAAFQSDQESSSTEVGIEFEIRGDVTITATLDNPSIYDLTNITIKGRHHPILQQSSGLLNSRPGGRIIWAFNGPLFEVNDTNVAMRGWRFENLEFRYTDGANTSPDACILKVTGASSQGADGISFHQCTVDGNGALASQGGASGRLAYVIRCDDALISNLSMTECAIYTHSAVIMNEQSDGGIKGLRVRDCYFNANNEVGAIIGSFAGGFIDNSIAGSGSSEWHFQGNRGEGMNGPMAEAYRLADSFIDHNQWFIGSNSSRAETLALGTGGAGNTNRVMIDHNHFKSESVIATSVVAISSQLDGTDFSGVMFDHNIVDGTNVASMDGVTIGGYLSQYLKGAIVSSNMVMNVDRAVVSVRTLQINVSNNVIQASGSATELSGDSSGANGRASYVVSGNFVELNGTVSVAFDDSSTSQYDSAQYNCNFVDTTLVTSEARAWNFAGIGGSQSFVNTISNNIVVGGNAAVVDRGVQEEGGTVNIYTGNQFLDVDTLIDSTSNIWVANNSGSLSTGVGGWNSALIVASKFTEPSGSANDLTLLMQGSMVTGCSFTADDELIVDVTNTWFTGCELKANGKQLQIQDPSDTYITACRFDTDDTTIVNSASLWIIGTEIGNAGAGTVALNSGCDDVTIMGSEIIGTFSVTTADADLIVTGTRIAQAATINSVSASLLANEWFSLTLSATSSDTAAVGNIVDSGGVVDSGTGNQVANNVNT